MRALILCEGKTDAILISYLLSRTSGWKYSKTGDPNISVKADDKRDESINWYQRGEDLLMICGVGGKNNFGSFFSDKIFPAIESYGSRDCFEKIVYLIDRDSDSDEDLILQITNDFAPITVDIVLGDWRTGEYIDSFGQNPSLEILGLVVPQDQEGALETVLLDALSQEAYEQNIIERCKSFVVDIKPEADRYINSSRLELKAKLSTVFAILSPHKVFSLIDELIKSIKWEDYPYIQNLFDKLIQL